MAEYDGPERRAATADEVAELRGATARLADQVGTLSLALQTVGHLQARQVEMDRKLNDTLAVAEEQRDLSQNLMGTLTELDEKGATKEEVSLARRIFVTRLTTALLLTLVAVTVLTLVAVNYVQGHNASIQKVCEDRNKGSVAIHEYIDRQRALAATKVLTPDQQGQMSLLNTVEQGFVVTNCGSIG